MSDRFYRNMDTYNEIISNIKKLEAVFCEAKIDIDSKEEFENLKGNIGEYEEAFRTNSQYNSTQYEEALWELLDNIDDYMRKATEDYIDLKLDIIKSFNSDLKRMKILERLAEANNNIVIIGANGAGKSSLVSSLQQSSISNLVVIPAQKALFYYPDASRSLHSKSIEDVKSILKKDFIKFSKGDFQSYMIVQEYLDNFSVLVTAISNDYTYHGMNNFDEVVGATPKEETIFNKLRTIWNILLPHITLNIDPISRVIFPTADGQRYHINSLSEGEKCIFFYIGNILMAPPNSYIIVDEPETFLNPSIYNKLWDLLCEYREDCQFVFCSHTIDFITSRINSTIVWNKKFLYPNYWDFEFLPENTSLPTSILTELLGSRKKILFCEGDDKNSYDYKVYSSLFLEDYTVIPVGGHTKVIQYVLAFNELNSLHNNKAIGIIDGDLLSDERIQEYKKVGIFTLPYNEIEMFLLSDEVMQFCLSDIVGEAQASEKIKTFKEQFYRSIIEKKEILILAKIKKMIDTKLGNYRIQNTKSFDLLKREYENLINIVNIEEERLSIMREIDMYLKEESYKDLLNLCNLKEMVSIGLANKYLDSSYLDKVVHKISSKSDLKKLLKDKYFVDITDNI